MLIALAAHRDRGAALSLRCIHVEHGIRPAAESRGDAEFVKSLCTKLNVPCRVISIQPGKIEAVAKARGMGIEAAARLYRRRALFREARRLETANKPAAVRILTAHTADDMRETALMRILRGSGPAGLAAMPASRGRILRPLITLGRHDVLDYLAGQNSAWREDSTNADTHFLRNRIRRCLVPYLSEHFPHWQAAITAVAETQSMAAAFIRDEAALRIKWDGVGDHSPHSLHTDAEAFFTQPPIIREEALFQGIDRLLPASSLSRGIKRKNIRLFSRGAVTAADLGPLRLSKNAQQIIISPVLRTDNCESFPGFHAPPATPHESGFALLIKAPGSYSLKGLTVEVNECQAAIHGDSAVFCALLPLVLRPRFNDDCIDQPCGRINPAGLNPGIVAAVDSLGVAAFISPAGLVQCREQAAPDGGNCRAVQVMVKYTNGGADV